MSGFQAAAGSGSVMILVIALLRLTAGKRLPRALFPALWCAAAFRLLLPVRLPSALSVWNLTAGESRAARTAAQISEHLTPFPSLTAAPAAQEAAARLSLPVMIWAAGALLLGAYFLVGWLRFTRRFAGAAPVGNETVDSCVKAFGFRRPPVIRCTTDSRAPLTYGVRRPVILLPADLLADREALRMILTHELAHIRRRDCLRKLLFTLCLCVYWWNPVCWGMVLLANRDLELACDALTLRYLGRDRRKTYALALLELAARQAQPHPLCSGFGKPAAEERIQAIMKAKKIPVYLTILAVVLAAAVVTVFATQAEPAAAPEAPAAPVQTAQPEASTSDEVTLEIPQTAAIEESQPADAAPEPAAQLQYVFPLEDADAAVLDSFGYRTVPEGVAWQQSQKRAVHRGVDLEAEEGSAILAVADGTVTVSTSDLIYGEQITIQHADGMLTTYSHLSERLVSEGDSVRQGQIIGRSGATGWVTGPHLHLDVQVNGEYVDPLEALG